MKRRVLIACLCWGLIAACPLGGWGQNTPPKVEVFVGASTLWETTAFLFRTTNPGFEAAVTYNGIRHVGLETNVSAFGNHTPGSVVNVDRFRILAGPRFAHTTSRVSLFVHALEGLTRGEECTAGCYLARYPPGPLAAAQKGANAFTTAVGGGVEVRLFREFWFRPIEANYVHVFFPYNPASVNGSSPEDNLQMAFGFAWHFGGRPK